MNVDLHEEDRQLVLLALAVLSIESPGFDDALNRIALRIDRPNTSTTPARASTYDAFRELRGPRWAARQQRTVAPYLGEARGGLATVADVAAVMLAPKVGGPKVEARTIGLKGDGGIIGTVFVESTGRVRVLVLTSQGTGPVLHGELDAPTLRSLGASCYEYASRVEEGVGG